MKRRMYKLITVMMIAAILMGPCVLGEAAAQAYSRIKLEFVSDYMGETKSYFAEVCEDEHGCLQETILIDIDGEQTNAFVQIEGDSVTYSIDGGETRELSVEMLLRALLRAALDHALEQQDEQDTRSAAYFMDGSVLKDAAVLSGLVPGETERFINAALGTGFMKATGAGIEAEGSLEAALYAFAAYLEALAVDFNALSAIRSLKIWALAQVTEAQLSLALPTVLMQSAIEIRALADKLASEGISGDIYMLSGDAFIFKVNVTDTKQDFILDVNFADERLNAELTLNLGGRYAYSDNTKLKLDADLNAETYFLYFTRKTETKYSTFNLESTTDLSAAYVDGVFSLGLRDVAESGALTELNADYANGALEASLSTTDKYGATKLHSLNADNSGVRVKYDADDGFNKTAFDAAVNRVSEGVYAANARYETRYSKRGLMVLDNDIFDISGTLDLNARTLDMAGTYASDYVSADTWNDNYAFGLNYADRALSAYFAKGDERADLSCAIAGEDGVYGANLLLEYKDAKLGVAPITLLSADLAIDFTKDALPVYALAADVYDIMRFNEETSEYYYESEHIGQLRSARTLEDGFSLDVASRGESILSAKAKAKQIPDGEAIDFSVTYQGETITGEIGYDVAYAVDAGANVITVRHFARKSEFAPNDETEYITLFELPITITISPDGVVTLQTVIDMGEDESATYKLTLEPLDAPPEHVYGRPHTAEELEQIFGAMFNRLVFDIDI